MKIVESGRANNAAISAAIAGIIVKLAKAGTAAGEVLPPTVRAFLGALAENCPRFDASDVDQVSSCLLEEWILPVQASAPSSCESSAHGSPLEKKRSRTWQSNGVTSPSQGLAYSPSRESLDLGENLVQRTHGLNLKGESPGFTPAMTHTVARTTSPSNVKERQTETEAQASPTANGSIARSGSLDQMTLSRGLNTGGAGLPHHLAIGDENLDVLQKQEMAFRFLAGILAKAGSKLVIKDHFLDQLRMTAGRQLKTVPSFLKLRRRDRLDDRFLSIWKINAKLQVSQAASTVYTKCFLLSKVDGEGPGNSLREALALLLDAADACVVSPWRRLKASEDLFDCLLHGLVSAAALCGSQFLKVLLLRLKTLVLDTCAQQAETWSSGQGPMFVSIVRASCKIVDTGWNLDRPAVTSFLLALATVVSDRNAQVMATKQLNVVRFLADLVLRMRKPEVAEMVLPLFVESLEEGNAFVPSLLRIRLLDSVACMASLGLEKSYRETVVLLTRSYLDKLSTVGSTQSRTLAPEATTERLETLPGAFLTLSSGLTQLNLRSDYRQRLLKLCYEVGLAAESKSSKSGADLLGPLLPAVAEACSDFEFSDIVEPSLLKLFRNLWFYIAIFGLAPPIQKTQTASKNISTSIASLGSTSAAALQAVAGPYMWNIQWSAAVIRIAQGTPPLVVSSVKWVEDELELNELLNPGSRRGSTYEKAALAQRAALSAALGGRIDTTSLNAISGVKATYLLAVTFLEILRLNHNGGILKISSKKERRSALSCAFEYLEKPNLIPAVYHCLLAIVHAAFDAAMAWLDERNITSGVEAEEKEVTIVTHACFLISKMTHRDENVRDLSCGLLNQIKFKYPQVLWNPSCLDALLKLVGTQASPSGDAVSMASMRSLVQQQARDWILQSLSLAPCTMQGLLQEQFRVLNSWAKASYTSGLRSLLANIWLDPTKNEGWSNNQVVIVPAVTAAAAAAAGAHANVSELGNLDLSIGIFSANIKSNYIHVSIGGVTFVQGQLPDKATGMLSGSSGLGKKENRSENTVSSVKHAVKETLIASFLQLLQQFITTADKGALIETDAFRETCLRSTAFLLSDLEVFQKGELDGLSQLLRLLCWCPAYICSSEAMETGIFIWTWLLSSAPHLSSIVLAELVDAWLWTIDSGWGLFACGPADSGPAAKLRPHLMPGEPVSTGHRDVVEGIMAHRLWLGFFYDRFEAVRHSRAEQLSLIGRLLQGSLKRPDQFSSHPAATGAFFSLMLLGLKFCACQLQTHPTMSMGIYLLEDRIYRAALSWFSSDPIWYESNIEGLAQAEAQALAIFVQQLASDRLESFSVGEKLGKPFFQEGENLGNTLSTQFNNVHPVWGKMDNYFTGREKRKQLLLMLCQHEADRLDTWANPIKDNAPPRLRVSSDHWVDYVKTAWSVDPRIALTLATRFPTVGAVKAEVMTLVQGNISRLYNIPEALPYFITPKAAEENSPILQRLPHWAPCSITKALEFLTPAYKGHPRIMAYVLRVLESYPPERVTFFMPQLVQTLRYDDGSLVERYLISAAQRSHIFAHILIWQLQGEEPPSSEDLGKEQPKANRFHDLVRKVKERIIESFNDQAHDMYIREFRFFENVTNISGKLYPLSKDERRAAIRSELEKIEIEGDDLYLPTAPNKLVRGIQLDSGIPLQSAAKVPIMITFNVVDKDEPSLMKPQACIFKVGDDCRQDVLALQVISLLRDIFEAVCVNLYLFPYGVLPTGCEKGIIEVVPNTRSRNQMGEITDGGLYEIFQQDHGPVGSAQFEAARENFIISSAGYAVASLLLQPKDRHNGNLLFDNQGRLVHIDFGFILETSPGGNLRFESAQFKLSHEMTQLLDPSGTMKSETWNRFVRLCVKGYLAARQHMDGIVNTVLLMVDSGLPCFSRGDPIGNLRKRFHPEMSEREAANFMKKTCEDAYNKWTTAGYDLIQYLQQGIEK